MKQGVLHPWRSYLPRRHEWLIAGACLLLLWAVSLARWQADREAIQHSLQLETEAAADQGHAFLSRALSARLSVTYALLLDMPRQKIQPVLDKIAENFSTYSSFFVTDLNGRAIAALDDATAPAGDWQPALDWAISQQRGKDDVPGRLGFTAAARHAGMDGFFGVTRMRLEGGEQVYLLQFIPVSSVISRVLDNPGSQKIALRFLIDGKPVYRTGGLPDAAAMVEQRSVAVGGRNFTLQVAPNADHAALMHRTGGTLTGLILPLALSTGIALALLAAMQFARKAVASEMRFRDFAETASDAVIETDRENRIIFDRSQMDWRFHHRNVLGRTILDVAGNAGMGATDRIRLADTLAARKPFRNLGVQFRDETGASRAFSVSGRPYYMPDGKFAGFRIVTSDLEGKSQSQAMLARAEALLSTAVEAISEAFALFDADDCLVLCNKRYRDRLPAELWPRLEAGGISFSEITRAAADNGYILLKPGQTTEDFLADRLEQRRKAPSLTTRQMRDGSWVQVWEWPVRGGGIVTVQTDITAAKLHEAALSESEARFRALVEELPLGLVVAGDGRALFLNNAFTRMFGYDEAAEILGLNNLSELLSEADQEGGAIGDYLAVGSRRAGLMPARGRNNDDLWLELRSMPVMWRGLKRQMLLLHDVTQQQHMVEALQKSKEAAEAANRSKSEFLANMSHELRTPLNAIIGFSEILTGELFGPVGHPRYHEYAEDIHKSGNHLLQIINDILDVAKAEAGRLELQEEESHLPELVEAALRMVRERANAGRVALSVALPDALPAILVDPLKLKQILLNLLSNAVKFTPSGGRIAVSARIIPDGALEIVVQDNGIGMPKDKIAMALEPFTQIDSSLARKFEGTGLGLPLVGALCRLHGGIFSIDSDVGAGTTATVILPAWRVAAGDAMASSPISGS